MATLFEAGIASAYAAAKGVMTLTPGGLNPDLDITFYCNDYDDDGNYGRGIGFAYALAYGSKPFIGIVATATAYAQASGSTIEGGVYSGTATAYALAYGDLLVEKFNFNWVSWSNIGALDFTIWKDNIAGRRPFDWKGW